jgi:hypothetical protein
MASLLTAFNDHFMEFVNDIQTVFPNDTDILTAKNSFIAIRKMNPKLLIKSWDIFVVGKYKSVIENGDMSFFMNKDYGEDLVSNPNSRKIMDAIDRLRQPVKMMNEDEQKKILGYIQNLTKISELYKATGL